MNFKDKKVLIRVDFNVPLDKDFHITDDTRIRAAIPSIKQLLERGSAVIIMSHLGRPLKKLKEDGSIDRERFTLKHIVPRLSELLGQPVLFAKDTVGTDATKKAKELKPGQVLLLENTRFEPGEKKGDRELAQKMANLADIYINDAFGTAHRAHASTSVVASLFDAKHKSFGLLMEKEILNANKLLNNPERPVTAIVGGAKVSDKMLLLDKLIDLADNIIIGGGMAYTFFLANGGHIGNSLVEKDRVELAKNLQQKAHQKGVNIYLPVDSIIADAFSEDAHTLVANSMDIPDGWMGLDIGPEAATAFGDVIKKSKTVLWNGPMGVFEMPPFAGGTHSVAKSVAEATANGAFTLIGGGDSVAAINQLGLADKVSYVSTGGGAMLKFLEGAKLPGIEAIEG
ncbi:MAG TPA: phosphoglycerate kinase [Saprospiraceae bacterium]|nr:phosphoglycerate kinase [Saprospiraceae bacterium]